MLAAIQSDSILAPPDSQHPRWEDSRLARALSVTRTGSKLTYFEQLKVRVADRQACDSGKDTREASGLKGGLRNGDGHSALPGLPRLSFLPISVHLCTVASFSSPEMPASRGEDRGHSQPQVRNISRQKRFLSPLLKLSSREGIWLYVGHQPQAAFFLSHWCSWSLIKKVTLVI